MRAGLWAVVCLVGFAPFADAQTVEKAKLRQSIEMPSVATSLGVQYRSSERDGRGNKFDPVVKVADLQKKLTGGLDDASVYLEMQALYLEVLKDEKKAKELAAKAEAVLRPIVQTKDPKQAYLVTIYASIIETQLEDPFTQCEAWAKYAVSVGPQDWRTWAYLAHTRQQQIPIILVGGDSKKLTKNRRTQEVLAGLYQRRLEVDDVNKAEKVLDEVMQYHDKAKQLAPNEAKRQEQRYGFRLSDIVLRNAIAGFRGEKKHVFPLGQLERTLLDELEIAAKLHPDHLLWQSQLAHQLIIVGWHVNKDNMGKPAKNFKPARPEDTQVIRDALGRIESIAAAGKEETGVYCYSMLAAICASMQDNAGAERYSRKILELDPKHQDAAEQLQQSLIAQEKKAEQLKAAQALAEGTKTPTPRNCFLLAKALVANERFDMAEQWCQAGLRLEPKDVHCILGLAALTMRKGDDAASLKQASELLDKAKRELRSDMGMYLFLELDYLTAIHLALSGDGVFARLKLERMQSDYPDAPRFEKALTAISR